MDSQTSSNEIFILLLLRDDFGEHRITHTRLLAVVQERRPSIAMKLYFIVENLSKRYLIVTNLNSDRENEYEITEAGKKYLNDEVINTQSFEMATKNTKLTKINTTWVIVAAIAAILGLLLAIYSICH